MMVSFEDRNVTNKPATFPKLDPQKKKKNCGDEKEQISGNDFN